MVASQITEFLKTGNISNSVNFPELIEERQSDFRLTLSNRNVAGMIGQITTIEQVCLDEECRCLILLLKHPHTFELHQESQHHLEIKCLL